MWQILPEQEVIRAVIDPRGDFLTIELTDLGIKFEEPEVYQTAMAVLRKIIKNAEYDYFRIVEAGNFLQTVEFALSGYVKWEFWNALDYDDQVLEEQYEVARRRRVGIFAF